jgi:hypothetical protein
MQTIVELPEFQARARTLLSDREKQGVINYLAVHPQAGLVMQGTGGIRKFRWASGHKGKSGGVRVIYYYHNESTPLFRLSVFGKKDKASLSKSESNELAKLCKLIVKNYGE